MSPGQKATENSTVHLKIDLFIPSPSSLLSSSLIADSSRPTIREPEKKREVCDGRKGCLLRDEVGAVELGFRWLGWLVGLVFCREW